MHAVRTHLVAVLLGVVLLPLALSLEGCGGGAGGGGPFTTVTFENDIASTHAIVQVDFSYLSLSGLPDRVETVDVLPGESARFDFAQGESDNFFDVTLTWSDASTTVIPLILVSGGDFSYPVRN